MPKKILLADDSITIQKVVELTFSDGDYEVIATNNGARAIQKLSEVRPDIVLTDIIMPEKNGYEVCEYVKSHPEFRSIPVILLTGTFEPFDPDRAEKAGCDAVVTKPFESQSLVHKVEELIDQSSRNSPQTAATADAVDPGLESLEGETRAWPLPSFNFGSTAAASEPPAFNAPGDADSPFAPMSSGADAGTFDASPFDAGSAGGAPEQSASSEEMFASADAAEDSPFAATSDALFAPPSPESETSFSEEPANRSPFAAEPESSFSTGADAEPPQAPAPFGEDRADLFAPPDSGRQELSFGDEPSSAPVASSFGGGSETSSEGVTATGPAEAPPEEFWSGETRAIPKLSFDDLRGYQESGASPASPWESSEPQQQAEPEEAERSNRNAAAWDDSFSSELSTGTTPITTPEADPWTTPEPPPLAATSEPAFEEPAEPQPAASQGIAREWSPSAGSSEPAEETTTETAATAAAAIPSAASPSAAPVGDLTDEQIERIARRVVELISDTTVRNVAWEVIPELAEMIVRQRIRELEAEEA